MKKYLSFIFAFCYLSHFGLSQEWCPTTLNLERIQKYDSERYLRILQLEEQVENYKEDVEESLGRSVPAVIQIPVVVHVLHNGGPIGTGLNISMPQIESQIDVLNEDFRRLNGDAGNTPAEFLPVASDAGIEFYLACFDPDGNPTNVVVRRQGLPSYTVAFSGSEVNETATGIKLGLMGLLHGQRIDI